MITKPGSIIPDLVKFLTQVDDVVVEWLDFMDVIMNGREFYFIINCDGSSELLIQ